MGSLKFFLTQSGISLFYGVDLHSNQILVGYSGEHYATIAPATLADWTQLEIAGLQLGRCLRFFAGSRQGVLWYEDHYPVGDEGSS